MWPMVKQRQSVLNNIDQLCATASEENQQNETPLQMAQTQLKELDAQILEAVEKK